MHQNIYYSYYMFCFWHYWS